MPPNVSLAQCPRCDKWQYASEFILCNRCGTFFETKVIWESALTLNNEYQVVFNFGKHKGETILSNPSYSIWILSQDFDIRIKSVIRKVLRLEEMK